MNRQERRLRLNQIALLVMCAVLVFLAWQSEQRFFQYGARLIVKQEAGDTVRFIWRSPVEAPMARRFADAFEEWRFETDHIIIDLNSPGGSLTEGRAVVNVIDRMKRTHLVETRVGPGRSCLSMCVPIYLKGDVRTAAPSSRWMFHEPTAMDAVTGEVVDIPEFERRYASNKFVRDYFVNSDMDPVWLEGLLQEWRGRDVWRTGRDLTDEGSGIIQRLE